MVFNLKIIFVTLMNISIYNNYNIPLIMFQLHHPIYFIRINYIFIVFSFFYLFMLFVKGSSKSERIFVPIKLPRISLGFEVVFSKL